MQLQWPEGVEPDLDALREQADLGALTERLRRRQQCLLDPPRRDLERVTRQQPSRRWLRPDPAKFAAAVVRREALTERVVTLLGEDGILILPTAHDLPPLRDAQVAAQVEFREKTLALTCVASLCRLPQINLPAVALDGCPVGLSLIAGPRGDQRLLALAEKIGHTLPAGARLP